ncbi:MAG: hypothetical protein MZU97_02165 [Bacillus subtilis]|nr:hypothetical protein [Bacillus subtilis]
MVAREVSAVCGGAGQAAQTEKIKDGQEVTVSCVEGENGIIYEGEILEWEETRNQPKRENAMPNTKVMFILGT